uniref:RING-type domain-containing protein n=1 Tax=Amazona collaria TaxID=241587 RepID=A0A8B9G030_9PSIT
MVPHRACPGCFLYFSYHACRCLARSVDLYYGLILPLYRATSILVAMITSIQLLTRCMKSYQSWRESKRQSKEEWPSSAPGMVRSAASYTDCAICLQAYEPGAELKLLSCSHAYHGKCIDLWHCVQAGSKTCPLCLRSKCPSIARQTAGTGIHFQT